MFLYNNLQIRQFENHLIQDNIQTEMQLMEAAGHAAFLQLQKHWPAARKIAVFCGKGKNAGDGFILARLAHQHHLEVRVYALAPIQTLPSSSQQAAQIAEDAGLTIEKSVANFSFVDVIVDAIFGSGLKGEVREPFAEIIQAINASKLPVLALDVPSGIDVDTGGILGCAVRAGVTVTFIGLKQGLFTNQAPAFCGKIIEAPLNISPSDFQSLTPSAKLLESGEIKPLLPKRQRNTFKNDYGHVLVIGGDYGMGGAVRMAAEAAMRVGAGLVTVATRPEHVTIVSGSCPELMCHQIANAEDLEPLLARATVLVVGPGLGKSEWSRSLINKILAVNLPKIIDADGLNLLAEKSSPIQGHWILTPHPGEASRLLSCQITEVQADRFLIAKKLQQSYGGVIVLKGAGTIIASKDAYPAVCPAGNPGMASGGMGDVLSGILGGLLAQKLSLTAAAYAGVFIHSSAADLAAASGGERGLLATDLLPYLRYLVNP